MAAPEAPVTAESDGLVRTPARAWDPSTKYVRCQCGWHQDTPGGTNASEILAAHAGVCPDADPWLLVPMWSVAWPYYWAVQDGDVPADHFGLEMAWRHVGTHTTNPRQFTTGMDVKEWHLFSPALRQSLSPANSDCEAVAPESPS